MSASIPLSSRARNQSRKKVNDDASYFGPTSGAGSLGTKRQATERLDVDSRVKRKRFEQPSGSNSKKDPIENEPKKSLVDFQKMSFTTLHRYLTQFDIVPTIYPSPLSAEDPPSPSALAESHQPSRPSSPPPSTPANRPRRDPREIQGRRRSSRLLEEETRSRVPILSDIADIHSVLASIADRHFKENTTINGREEVDTLAAFMCAIEKSKGGKNKMF